MSARGYPPEFAERLRGYPFRSVEYNHATKTINGCSALVRTPFLKLGAVVPYADHLIRVPATPVLMQPILATVPLQVFACEMAAAMGLDVDQPRNLAKSVTVE